MTAPVDFTNPDAVVAYYNAHYPVDIFQGQDATCGTCCLVTAIMARYLFANGTPMPFLSWPYAYYRATGDATFNGTGGGEPINVWVEGICADVYYRQEDVIRWWNNGFPYPPEHLPQPPAYADAPNQKILDYGTLINGSIAETLQHGIPVVFMVGYHAICAIAVSADGYWFYCKDSLQPRPSTPDGIRIVSRDNINPAATPLPVTSVYWSGTNQPPGGDLSTPQQVIAAIPAVQPPWDDVTYPQLEAATAAAAPPHTPTPPTGEILPPNPIPVDAAGNVWTWGAFVSDRFGWELHMGGRGLRTVLAVAIVDGVLRANDPGGGPTAQWYMFTGTAASPAWTPTSAP